jgi:esterase/lipase superfamily enzyme
MPRKQGSTNGGDEPTTNSTRRTFLQGATTAVVGGLGVMGMSGQAAALSYAQEQAPDGYPIVSTRDHFDEDADLINGQTPYSYQAEGDWAANEEWGYSSGDDLVIWVHGFLNGDKEAILLPQGVNAGYATWLALRGNGYDEFLTAFSWDADEGRSLDLGWADAKDIASANGRKLANFITDWNADVGGSVKIVAHSLGARVAGAALWSLENDFGAADAVDEVALLGAAIGDGSIAWGGRYYDAIEYSSQRLTNYYSYNDGILDYVFETREVDEALGQEGTDGWPPDNYVETDVSGSVDTHLEYYQPDMGCMPTVAADFR